MREEVARHRIRLSVYRDYGPNEEWLLQPVGLDMELRALVLSEHPFDDEAAHRVAYEVALRAARWAFAALDRNPRVAYEFDGFDGHIVIQEGAQATVEVELAGHVFHRDQVRGRLDDDERGAADEVRDRLRLLGVRD
jgi:hypothetical protein